jgi:hypothetical protein
MIFGSKSERHIGNDPSQLSLGLDVEAMTPPEKETEQITYTRNKPEDKKGSAIRLVLPSHLHREEYVLERMQKLYMVEREAREKDMSFEQGKSCVLNNLFQCFRNWRSG